MICSRETHAELKKTPEVLLRLRPWPDWPGGADVGECPKCNSSLIVEHQPEASEVAA